MNIGFTKDGGYVFKLEDHEITFNVLPGTVDTVTQAKHMYLRHMEFLIDMAIQEGTNEV